MELRAISYGNDRLTAQDRYEKEVDAQNLLYLTLNNDQTHIHAWHLGGVIHTWLLGAESWLP